MDSCFSSDDINKKNQLSHEEATDLLSQKKKDKSDILQTNFSSSQNEKKQTFSNQF